MTTKRDAADRALVAKAGPWLLHRDDIYPTLIPSYFGETFSWMEAQEALARIANRITREAKRAKG